MPKVATPAHMGFGKETILIAESNHHADCIIIQTPPKCLPHEVQVLQLQPLPPYNLWLQLPKLVALIGA